MMKYLVIPFVLVTTMVTQASVSNSASWSIESVKSSDLGEARIHFLNQCQEELKRLKATPLKDYISRSACTESRVAETVTTYQILGQLNLEFHRPLRVEFERIETGFTTSESQSQKLYDMLCSQWQSNVPTYRKEAVIYQTCGIQKWDRFYEKPQLSSVAVRVETVRTDWADPKYCECRRREIREVFETDWEPIISYRYVYDLMQLSTDGYYSRVETFDDSVLCDDARFERKSCH